MLSFALLCASLFVLLHCAAAASESASHHPLSFSYFKSLLRETGRARRSASSPFALLDLFNEDAPSAEAHRAQHDRWWRAQDEDTNNEASHYGRRMDSTDRSGGDLDPRSAPVKPYWLRQRRGSGVCGPCAMVGLISTVHPIPTFAAAVAVASELEAELARLGDARCRDEGCTGDAIVAAANSFLHQRVSPFRHFVACYVRRTAEVSAMERAWRSGKGKKRSAKSSVRRRDASDDESAGEEEARGRLVQAIFLKRFRLLAKLLQRPTEEGGGGVMVMIARRRRLGQSQNNNNECASRSDSLATEGESLSLFAGRCGGTVAHAGHYVTVTRISFRRRIRQCRDRSRVVERSANPLLAEEEGACGQQSEDLDGILVHYQDPLASGEKRMSAAKFREVWCESLLDYFPYTCQAFYIS